MKIKNLNGIIDNTISKEIKKVILEQVQQKNETYHVTLEGEPIETFKTYEQAEQYVMDNKDKHDGKELLIDKKKYGSYEEMIDKLDEMGEQLEQKNTDMKKKLKENMEEYSFDMDEQDDYLDSAYEDRTHLPDDESYGYDDDDETITDEDFEEEGGVDDYHKMPWAFKFDDRESLDLDEDDSESEFSDFEDSEGIDNLDIDSYNQGINYTKNLDKYGSKEDMQEGMGMCSECGSMLNEEGMCSECGGGMNEYDLSEENLYEGQMCSECGSMLNEEGMCSECGGGMNEYDLSETDDMFDDMSEDEMCSECGSMEEELYEYPNEIYESKKKKLIIKESDLVKLIKKMVNESIPGKLAAEKAKTGSGKDNKSYYDSVGKKMKDYLKFDGNDNPEFPHQIGKGKKVARQNTPQQEDEVAKNFAGLQNLEYDVEPSENFKKRLKMAIEGDSKMGNGVITEKPSIKPSNGAEKGKEAEQKSGNQIKTKTSDKLNKQVKNRKEDKEKRVIYKKEKVPVNTSKKEDKSLNESRLTKDVLGEIEKMKRLVNYNKKTQ